MENSDQRRGGYQSRRHRGVLGHSWWKTSSLRGCCREERKTGGCAPNIGNTAVEPDIRVWGAAMAVRARELLHKMEGGTRWGTRLQESPTPDKS